MSTENNKNENLTLVENEGAVNSSLVTIKLSKPFEYEGNVFEELSFDFDKLTGADDKAIERELQAKNLPVMVAALSTEYLVRMCARACTAEIGHDAFDYMPLKDHNKIKTAGRNFLLKSE